MIPSDLSIILRLELRDDIAYVMVPAIDRLQDRHQRGGLPIS